MAQLHGGGRARAIFGSVPLGYFSGREAQRINVR